MYIATAGQLQAAWSMVESHDTGDSLNESFGMLTRYNMHVVKGCVPQHASPPPCICIIPGCTVLSEPLAEAVQDFMNP